MRAREGAGCLIASDTLERRGDDSRTHWRVGDDSSDTLERRGLLGHTGEEMTPRTHWRVGDDSSDTLETGEEMSPRTGHSGSCLY